MPDEAKPSLKVFLCHASADKDVVHNLYESLVERGIDAWLDVEKLWPGMNWEEEITRAVKKTDVVVVCLSKNSVNKAGFVQKEIVFALDKASEKPEGTIFLIPARLEVCDVPDRLSPWQWVDLFAGNGFPRLMGSLQRRATQLGVSLEDTGLTEGEGLKQKLEQLYDEGLEAQWTEDWETACNRFETIFNLQPGYRDTVSKLRLMQRNRRLSNLYRDALESKKSENWQKVVQLLEELSTEAAFYEDSVQLLEMARKKVQVFQHHEEAKRLYKAHKWKAVIKVFEQIAAIDPDYGDPDNLRPSANEKVLEIERLERLKEFYHLAIRKMDAGKWNEALDLLGKVQELDPNYLKTQQLVKKVQSELNKIEAEKDLQSQIEGLYEDAHRALKSKRWNEALKIIDNIRSRDRNFDDRDQIHDKAGKGLRSEEERIKFDTELQAMYNEAVRLMRDKKYQVALEKWEEIVARDPGYPDLQKVQVIARREQKAPTRPWAGIAIFVGIASLLILLILPQIQLPGFPNFATPSIPPPTNFPSSASPEPKFVTELTILPDRVPGTTFDISETGFYILQYKDGAWAVLGVPDSSNERKWSTNLLCFRGSKEQIGWYSDGSIWVEPVYSLTGDSYTSSEDAKSASLGRKARFYMHSGDHLSCVVNDRKLEFWDNKGEIVMELYYSSSQ